MTIYRIRLKEKLAQHWSAWLGGLTVIHEANGETVLIARGNSSQDNSGPSIHSICLTD
jgi:hypothetical protein